MNAEIVKGSQQTKGDDQSAVKDEINGLDAAPELTQLYADFTASLSPLYLLFEVRVKALRLFFIQF